MQKKDLVVFFLEGLIENEAFHKTPAFSVNLGLARNLLKFRLLQGFFFL